MHDGELKVLQPPAVPSEIYTREYYERICGGHEEFARSRGESLPRRIKAALRLCQPVAGRRVLDLGSGRGEASLHLVRAGAEAFSVDLAPAASSISSELRSRQPRELRQRYHVVRADARCLPFPSGSFDRVLMLDMVEHLAARELDDVLGEVRRVLAPVGRLVVHTMPNLWYYRFGFPVYRRLMALRGVTLPRDPRARVSFMNEMHVNEQSPVRLRGFLSAAGLSYRVWLQSTEHFASEPSRLWRVLMCIATRVPPLKAVCCDEIFAVAWKP